ncbi:hypothetical protein Pan14r_08830 [Crateriforma conspicua]|uniref:Uncharacterized protein n=1 Tax=Crateriforma conspicua TaxID=2527996 RepID=A0A5C5XYZ3_9PLAN|nr:hypothetical protein Pan14r_08830 [Crateriforma conspicua]
MLIPPSKPPWKEDRTRAGCRSRYLSITSHYFDNIPDQIRFSSAFILGESGKRSPVNDLDPNNRQNLLTAPIAKLIYIKRRLLAQCTNAKQPPRNFATAVGTSQWWS